MLTSADHPVFGSGSLIVDSATGIRWLKLQASGTRSYNDLTGADGSDEFMAGGVLAGFRHATVAEVEALWIGAGIPKSAIHYGGDVGPFSTNNGLVFNAARALQQMIGFKLNEANLPHLNAGGWDTKGIAVDANGLSLPSLHTCTPGTGFCGGSSLPITRAHLQPAHATYWQPIIGQHHWLVYEGVARPTVSLAERRGPSSRVPPRIPLPHKPRLP